MEVQMEMTDGLVFHHLGIVVSDIEVGKNMLNNIFGTLKWSDSVVDNNQFVTVCFGRAYGTDLLYELVAPLNKGSPVDNVLKEKKNVINHTAYKTNEFQKTCQNLRKVGCVPITRAMPAAAFDNALVIFYLTPLNFIIEVIENKMIKNFESD